MPPEPVSRAMATSVTRKPPPAWSMPCPSRTGMRSARTRSGSSPSTRGRVSITALTLAPASLSASAVR